MKLILWGQQLESGYSPNIILPANYLTYDNIYFIERDALPWLPRVGLGADGRKQTAREIATPFANRCVSQAPNWNDYFLPKWGIRCAMSLPFQQNEAPEITELFSKVQKMTEEINWVMFCYEKPWGKMVTKLLFVWGRGGIQGMNYVARVTHVGMTHVGMYLWTSKDLSPPR